MNSDGFSSVKCFRIVDMLHDFLLSASCKEYLGKDISIDDVYQLYYSCQIEKDTENSNRFSEPMVWIGIYIAIASFFCLLAMAADLLHGFQNKKFWFPCKYFSLNAASITVITVAMKLTVDLSTEMPSYIDQATKLGSLGFMCTMMANLMPSLASMDNKTLLANVIGLSILVITMIVNICIEINTTDINSSLLGYVMDAYIYMVMIILLLIIVISSSLTIPTSKEILDSKYQVINKKSSTDQSLQHIQMSKVEKLRQHVRRYWVIAETGSPQFVMASNPLSTASGIICVLSLFMNIFLVLQTITVCDWTLITYKTSYKWSIAAIFVTQFIGVVVGAIAPIVRCFSVCKFKLAPKWNKNHLMFFKVEKCWTQKLHDWKQSPILFLSSSRRLKRLFYNSKSIILSLCIGFQMVIVVSCKLIWLTVTIILIFVVNYVHGWKLFKVASRTEDTNEGLSHYVLQIDNEILELSENTLKGFSNSMNSYILKAAKEQNNNLLELLQESNGFKGVQIFDTEHIQPLLPFELVNGWSLPIVTLTCIAVVLPNIPTDTVENLFKSVDEGLSYTHLVEESLNCGREYVTLRKTSTTLWHEVEHKCRWLDIPLAKKVFKGKTAREIIRWFSDKAKEIVIEINGSTDGEAVKNPPKTLVAANSMYRITQAILLRYQSNKEPITHKQLFTFLNRMIADIFYACFTNIPRVIKMRCHESVIEKREASVKVAAKLLGKTTKIIERLETLELPGMDDDQMAYIDEWRLYLKQSIP